jgi:cytochrome P450
MSVNTPAFPCPIDDIPSTNIDIFSDASLLDPYPVYDELRELGPVVWLNAHGLYMLTRFNEVKSALANDKDFISSKGVMMNEPTNEATAGITLCSNGESHKAMRKVLIEPLTPPALKELKEQIFSEAENLVEALVAKKRFNAATDLAQHLPLTIVSKLVGVPEEGRERMLEWSTAGFNCIGPMNKRAEDSFPLVGELAEYLANECTPDKLTPGGWAAKIWEAADRGEISHDQCPAMMTDYMGPSLDTTISATQSAIYLFAKHPEQWEKVRKNPAIIPNAINEIIRMYSPAQNFSRLTARDVEIGGVTLPKDSRVIVSYASANRDPRKWEKPHSFNVERRAQDQLGFGFGAHQCIGNNLARLEIRALLIALADKVERFELHQCERSLTNVAFLYKTVEVSLH